MTKYKYSRLQLAERARHTEYSWSNLAEDLFAKAPTPQAGKECEVAHNGYGFDAGGRYEYDDIKNKVYDKPTAPTKQGKSNGLVCPDCLVEHCQHCKCEKCSKQEKEALGNQASGKVNLIKTWKELGEVMKGKKVKEFKPLTLNPYIVGEPTKMPFLERVVRELEERVDGLNNRVLKLESTSLLKNK